jgi:Zn-dependent alcohol dehydrogenase
MTGAGAVVNTANVRAGESVAIFGVGGVGLSAVAAARIVGASPIIAVDLDDEKLKFARQFGATHTINARTENPVEAVHALTEQQGVYTFQDALVSGADYTFDCIGLNDTMTQSITACRKGQVGVRTGGAAVLVGLPTDALQLNAMEILISERSLLGSNCGSCTPERDIPRFLEWHNSGKLDLDTLVTRRYKLDDINDAVAELAAGEIRGRAIIEF